LKRIYGLQKNKLKPYQRQKRGLAGLKNVILWKLMGMVATGTPLGTGGYMDKPNSREILMKSLGRTRRNLAVPMRDITKESQ